jgi:hypothetical protein
MHSSGDDGEDPANLREFSGGFTNYLDRHRVTKRNESYLRYEICTQEHRVLPAQYRTVITYGTIVVVSGSIGMWMSLLLACPVPSFTLTVKGSTSVLVALSTDLIRSVVP